MSVDLEALIMEMGADPRVYVTTPRFMGSVRFEAGRLRTEGLMVGYEPLPDNACHGEVWGAFTRSLQRRLQAAATWFVQIDDVSVT